MDRKSYNQFRADYSIEQLEEKFKKEENINEYNTGERTGGKFNWWQKKFYRSNRQRWNNIFRKDIEAIKIVLLELDRKNKIIDKMAQKIVKVDNSDQYCLGRKRMCPYDKPTQTKCKECVKYYYEKRNKRW